IRQVIHLLFFFFSSRRRHTRLQGDWSSDVYSSDLKSCASGTDRLLSAAPCTIAAASGCSLARSRLAARRSTSSPRNPSAGSTAEIGRASCRERGESRVGRGGGREKRSGEDGGREAD